MQLKEEDEKFVVFPSSLIRETCIRSREACRTSFISTVMFEEKVFPVRQLVAKFKSILATRVHAQRLFPFSRT